MPAQTTKLPYPEFSTSGYRSVRAPFFSIKKRQNGLSLNRIGVVVGVHVMKRAVDRNFWKRQVRATLRSLEQSGDDILVIFSKRPPRSKKQEVKQTLLCHISTK
jgi:ribonuclease P protein component